MCWKGCQMKYLKITTIIHHTSAYLPPPPLPPFLQHYSLLPQYVAPNGLVMFPLLPPPRCSTMVSSNSPQVRTGSMPRCPYPLPSQASEGHLPPWRPTPSGSRLPDTTQNSVLSLPVYKDHNIQLTCCSQSPSWKRLSSN